MTIEWKVLSADDARGMIEVRYVMGELERTVQVTPGPLEVEEAIKLSAPVSWFQLQTTPAKSLMPAVGMTGTLET